MRAFLRILTFVMIGPLVGTVLFVVGTGVYTWLTTGRSDDLVFAATHILGSPPIIVFGYVLGGVPALIAGVAASIMARRMAPDWRYRWWVTFAGGVAGLVGTGWIAIKGFGDDSGPVSVWAFLALMTATGAISALASIAVFDSITAMRKRRSI